MVKGRVLEENSSRPVTVADVLLLDTVGATLARDQTDSEGSFTLLAPGAGSYLVLVERLGFYLDLGDVIDLAEGDTVRLTVHLEAKPVEVEGIVAEGSPRPVHRLLEREGFYRRQKSQSGWFMDFDQIAKSGSYDTANLLQRAPFVTRYEGFGLPTGVQMTTRAGGQCRPGIQVDGLILPVNIDLNDFVDVDNILGVEVFRGRFQVPPQWGRFGGCGMILIWTRLRSAFRDSH